MIFITESYFDGEKFHTNGPYTIYSKNGVINDIQQENTFPPKGEDVNIVEFLMPGMVESHCHLFLDGGELGFKERKDYLSESFENKVDMGKKNLEKYQQAGITLVRDAGDINGVNTSLKNGSFPEFPEIRSPGRALRKKGRYGGFMAEEVLDFDNIEPVIQKLAENADDLKVLMTGIIDFENGIMKGKIQFNEEEIREIVRVAKKLNLLTYAHCSGKEGLEIAVNCGINSIEHGFFMDDEILQKMADNNIAWVPTFSPVYFQYEFPHYCNWNEATVTKLKDILDNHFEKAEKAVEMGVNLIGGSDAGSYGAEHGKGLIDELFFFEKAGIDIEYILRSVTSIPRNIWGCQSADIKIGNDLNMIELVESPLEKLENIRSVKNVFSKKSQSVSH